MAIWEVNGTEITIASSTYVSTVSPITWTSTERHPLAERRHGCDVADERQDGIVQHDRRQRVRLDPPGRRRRLRF